ncbi:MAG: DUF6261 family protein [Prevotellaceae bacterium]|nr:DUF6261 family protein [Prevotellaceae bacterium]
MKIIKIDLRHLRNEEHFQLMTDFKNLVEATGASVLNIEALFATFLVLYGREDIALEAIRRSELTDAITDTDTQRDTIYRGLVLMLESNLHSSNPSKKQAAHNMLVVVNHYGDFRHKSYNEETAGIYNFVQEINTRCAAEIATLDAKDWITDLDNANQTFDKLMNQRFDENAGQIHVNLRETRKEIDGVYTQTNDYIDAAIVVNGESVYAGFVNKLNERIRYFKNTLAQRKGRAAKKNGEE